MIATRQYSSGSEIIAGAAAVRQRLFSPQIAPVKREEPIEQVRIYLVRPEPPTPQQDEHVREWRRYLKLEKETPALFVRRRCEELGVSYREIVGPSRAHHLIEPRHQIMAETKVKFPRASLPQIGGIFNRDHTVVYFALKKFGLTVAPVTMKSLTSQIKQLYDKGASAREIAETIGFTKTSINTFIKRQGWTR